MTRVYVDEEELPKIGVPKGALVGALVLILLSIALAAASRLTGLGRTALGAPDAGAVTREIRFERGPDEAIVVRDERTGQPLASFGAQSGGFVRGSLRALGYERERRGLTLEGAPFRIVEWRNGRLTLDDPATGYHVELNAFGPDNLEAYRRLLR